MPPEIETKPEELKSAAPENSSPVAPETPPAEVTFPALPKGAAVFYEDERHEVWIGIPLEQQGQCLDATFLMAILDNSKLQALAHLANFQIGLMRRRQLELSPVGGRLKKTMSDVFGKVKSFVA